MFLIYCESHLSINACVIKDFDFDIIDLFTMTNNGFLKYNTKFNIINYIKKLPIFGQEYVF